MSTLLSNQYILLASRLVFVYRCFSLCCIPKALPVFEFCAECSVFRFRIYVLDFMQYILPFLFVVLLSNSYKLIVLMDQEDLIILCGMLCIYI